MLGRHGQLTLMFAKVQERIQPGIDVGTSAECVAGAGVGGNVLLRVMDL